MDVKIIACTHVGHEAEKNKYDDFSGKMVGVTNTPDNLKTLMYEDVDKAYRRSESSKSEGKRDYFNHECFTLYFEGLPKIVSVIIDSMKTFAKSEKASKFNELYLSREEEVIYNKWIDLFKNKLAKSMDAEGKVHTDIMLTNLAENYAVYLKSAFSPIVVAYTATYGEFNRLIGILENYVAEKKFGDFEDKLSRTLIEVVLKLKELPYYDKQLAKVKDKPQLFAGKDVEEYFGDVYSTNYKCSIECLSDLLVDSVNYQIKTVENEYYVPSIIADNKDLTELWLSDIVTLGNYPLATLVSVSERGDFDEFATKLSRLEKNEITKEENDIAKEILSKYDYSLRLKTHARAEELLKYVK